MDETEVEINVPWGQITCKLFGESSSTINEIVLFLHDINDNASSFDEIIRNLKETRLYIAIDLPGHGKSSPTHTNATYHFSDYILAIKYVIYRLQDQYNQRIRAEKVVLVGHGKCAHLATVFTQIYQKFVSKLILLDGMYDYGIESSDFVEYCKKYIEMYFTIGNIKLIKSPQECSLENVQEMFRKKFEIETMSELCNFDKVESNIEVTVRALAKRGARQIDNGHFLLRNDLQLKNMMMQTSGCDYMLDFLRKHPVTCPVLILCTQSTINKHKRFVTVLKGKNSKVEVINVPFEHYHVKMPEKTSEYFSRFLNLKKATWFLGKL